MISRISIFWVSTFLALTGFAVVEIYGFNKFEANLGQSISLQVTIWLSTALSLIGTAGYFIGIKVGKTAPSKLRSLTCGAGLAIFMIVSTMAARAIISHTVFLDTFIIISSFIVSILMGCFFKDNVQSA